MAGIWFKDQLGVTHVDVADAEGSCRIGERVYRWEFTEFCGPSFLRKDGSPLKSQPGEHHPVWPHFERWLKQYEKRKARRK